ncbi:MAG: EthD family reductase [Ignavibacteriae bacterium]|nr:EthD family reductase [Ignavibacteriota bacterium]
MTKLIALYRKSSDPAAFDKHYNTVHTPLVKRYPGLRKLEITRITGAPIGETKFHLMAEMYFDSKDAMDAALASPEGRAVAKDLMSFAADVVTVFFGETDKVG